MSWTAEDQRDRKPSQQCFLGEALKAEITNVYLPRYPTRRAALIPSLHLIQHQYGFIPEGAIREIAQLLGISPAEARDTASFYEEFHLKPKGKHLVAVCRSLSCEICGSPRIVDRLRKRLGIEVGETTPDGEFTLVEVECLGACGGAPAMLIDEDLHENLTQEGIEELLERAKSKENAGGSHAPRG